MCGFVAGMNCERVSDAQISASLDALSHRGPDGSGTWRSSNRRNFLGHVRLSIIGLSNGVQPISNATQNIHIVVNGEFYDYQKIRSELIADGAVFSTESDSEIALHLYERYGSDGFAQLRGEFSIIILDERKDCLIAVRDRFGIKPLFYALSGTGCLLASEAKALFQLGIVPRWDLQTSFMDSFMFRTSERSVFDGVRSVPPGHYAVFKDGEMRQYRYWDWRFDTHDGLIEDKQAGIQAFRDAFEDSVRTRLVADVPVGCYLSGGIDSCATVGVAQAVHDRPIETFTLHFDNPLYDESALAAKQAGHVGANHNPVMVTRQLLADVYPDAVWHSEIPMVNANGAAKFILSRAVREAGIKTVITGEGADEMLGGYVPFRRDHILAQADANGEARTQELLDALFASNEATRAVFMREGADDPAVLGVRQRLGWVPSIIETYGQLGRILSSFYRDELIEEMQHRNPFTEMMDEQGSGMTQDFGGRLNQSLYLNSKSNLHNFILTYLADRMEMAHSVEGRLPFLDHSVAEVCARLPAHLKIHDRTEKYVLREAVRDVVIPEVYSREKHPFSAPPSEEGDPLMELYEDALASKALDEQSIFDPAKARSAMDLYKAIEPDQRIAFEGILHRIASITIMHERFSMSG